MRKSQTENKTRLKSPKKEIQGRNTFICKIISIEVTRTFLRAQVQKKGEKKQQTTTPDCDDGEAAVVDLQASGLNVCVLEFKYSSIS